jgi:hypothetical protein
MSNVIELSLLDQAAEIAFDELDPEVSTVTGRELRRIEITLTVRDDETRDALHARFGTGEPLLSSDGTAWQVGNSSSSSSRNGGAPWHVTAQLQEKETFSIDRIEFEDLELTPDKLDVLTDTGRRLVLTFSVDRTAEQHEIFQALLSRTSRTPPTSRAISRSPSSVCSTSRSACGSAGWSSSWPSRAVERAIASAW